MNIYVIFAAIVLSFGSSWKVHDWYDDSKQTKSAEIAATAATKITANEQKIRIVYVKSKDTCLTSPMPASVRGLLASK